MERWHFKCLFGWEGMREKKWWGLGVFSHPAHPKCFLPKMGRKPGRRGGGGSSIWAYQNAHVHYAHGRCSCHLCVFCFLFWPLFLTVLFIYLSSGRCSCLFFFFFFFLYSCFFFYFFVFWFFLYFSIVFLFFIFYVLIFLWLVLF